MAAEHIAIVGKGGVGKSTTAANLGAALAEAGRRVALIGYDSWLNSTALLRGDGELKPMNGWHADTVAPLATRGFREALCIEAGGLPTGYGAESPFPLERLEMVEEYGPEFFVHDITWEPGEHFFLPIAPDAHLRLFMVTTADFAAIRAANELFRWLNRNPDKSFHFGGLIVNNLSGPFYESIVADYLERIGVTPLVSIPRSLMVVVNEFHRRTQIEAAPCAHNSFAYRKLARLIMAQEKTAAPGFLARPELNDWALKWGDIITELETGIVRDGASI